MSGNHDRGAIARMGISLALGMATAGVAACGSPRVRQDPLDYLQVGVDPQVEARVIERSLRRAGFAVWWRVQNEHVIVLEGLRGTDEASAVRVVTRAGTAMGLDSPDRRYPARVRVGALREPTSGHDLDLDEARAPEVLLFVRESHRVAPCIAVVRIDREGGAHEVPTPAPEIHEDACVERAEDIDGDGRSELIVVARFFELGLPVPPQVAVPFVGIDGHFARSGPLARRHYARERSERQEAIRAANADQASDAVTRLAIELGLLRLYETGDVDGAIEALYRLAPDDAHVDELAAAARLLRALGAPQESGDEAEADGALVEPTDPAERLAPGEVRIEPDAPRDRAPTR